MARSSELVQQLGLGSREDAQGFLESARSLRNLLAHSRQDLVEDSSWEQLSATVLQIEALLDRSDALLEG